LNFLAILAAALYAINAQFSKLLLEFMPPTLMAGFYMLDLALLELHSLQNKEIL